MEGARIDSGYSAIIQNIYDWVTFHVEIDDDLETYEILLGKIVRQGDTISSKLFTLALENIFKKRKWE